MTGFRNFVESIDHGIFDAVRRKIRELRPDWDVNVHWSLGRTAEMGLGPQMQYKVDLTQLYDPSMSVDELTHRTIDAMLDLGAEKYVMPDYANIMRQHRDDMRNPNHPAYGNAD